MSTKVSSRKNEMNNTINIEETICATCNMYAFQPPLWEPHEPISYRFADVDDIQWSCLDISGDHKDATCVLCEESCGDVVYLAGIVWGYATI